MAEQTDQGEQVLGCILALWSLLITGPIWLILLFAILQALGDSVPVWAWVLYWVYVPACVLGIASSHVAKTLLRGE